MLVRRITEETGALQLWPRKSLLDRRGAWRLHELVLAAEGNLSVCNREDRSGIEDDEDDDDDDDDGGDDDDDWLTVFSGKALYREMCGFVGQEKQSQKTLKPVACIIGLTGANMQFSLIYGFPC